MADHRLGTLHETPDGRWTLRFERRKRSQSARAPPSSNGQASSASTSGRTSSRGPVAGVNGAADSSFG